MCSPGIFWQFGLFEIYYPVSLKRENVFVYNASLDMKAVPDYAAWQRFAAAAGAKYVTTFLCSEDNCGLASAATKLRSVSEPFLSFIQPKGVFRFYC